MATGHLFDGLSAQEHPVLLSLDGDALAILRPIDGSLWRWPVAEIRRADPDAPGPAITLCRRREPARLVLADPALVEQLQQMNRRLGSPGRWSTRHWSATIAALVAAVAGVALLVDLAPALLLPLVPSGLERQWSNGIERAITLGGDRCTGQAGQAALDRLGATLSQAAGIAVPPSIAVFDDPDVNAFTLPDGRILLLCGLIDHVSDPEQLAGVLAHELGHNRYRDPTRAMLRRLELSMLVRSLGWGGDLGSRMAALSYGRRAEARADASAIDTLHRAGLRADGLARFLGSLQGGHRSAAMAFLSDHPGNAERVAQLPHDIAGRTAMDQDQWLAVKRICATP